MIIMIGDYILNMDHTETIHVHGSCIYAVSKNERYGSRCVYEGKNAKEIFADVQRQIRDQISNVKSGN